MGNKSREGRHVERRIEFHEVRPDDLPAVEEWARLRCKGNSVEKLASAFDLEPRLDIVIAHIARGLPPKSRAVVEEVCEAELKRSE
jgi:hypothetical protein